MKRFEMNGKGYETDTETHKVLKEQVEANNIQCIAVIMTLGLNTGRIKEL